MSGHIVLDFCAVILAFTAGGVFVALVHVDSRLERIAAALEQRRGK